MPLKAMSDELEASICKMNENPALKTPRGTPDFVRIAILNASPALKQAAGQSGLRPTPVFPREH